MKNQFPISKKICMLGSFGVGKTSLVRRFIFDEFREDYHSTIGVLIHKKAVSLTKDGNFGLNFILWDIAHIEKFNDIIKTYFQGSHGAIVVFDVTRSQSFKEVDVYLKPYLAMNPQNNLIFVGNKIDLVDKHSNNMEQLLQLSKTYNVPSVLTSAKTSENVDKLFHSLATQFVKAE